MFNLVLVDWFQIHPLFLLMSFCAVAARYADMKGRRDLEVDIRL